MSHFTKTSLFFLILEFFFKETLSIILDWTDRISHQMIHKCECDVWIRSVLKNVNSFFDLRSSQRRGLSCMFFIVCFKSEILQIFLAKLKFEPLLADLISILGGERGRSYSLGLGTKTGSKCFKLICICMDAAMTEFKEEQGPALKASLDSLPALAWAGTLLCISAGRFRPSHQEVASQCQELSQLATKTFEWPVLLDRQKVCLINYLQVLFLQGLLHVARQIICERSSSAQQRSILHSS